MDDLHGPLLPHRCYGIHKIRYPKIVIEFENVIFRDMNLWTFVGIQIEIVQWHNGIETIVTPFKSNQY